MKISFFTIVFLSIFSSWDWYPQAAAAPPWLGLVKSQQVEAKPDKSYELMKEHGPWMIMAMTYRGPNAKQEASRLVYELRKQHKLTAYTHLEIGRAHV